ncbi:MAG: nucleotidyl transferase AbiEii/AbiGii toxin family protein [Akkermansiaceae bacterium]
MNRIAILPDAERGLIFEETAARKNIAAPIVEKDFWVCWMLGLLFGHAEWSEALLFKGGTALSKVYGLIRRFSEDIDLSVSPSRLGFSEADVEAADTRNKRDDWMQHMEKACRQWVAGDLQPELEQAIVSVLGRSPKGSAWLQFEIDEAAHSPTLLFHYASSLPSVTEYIKRSVKLEFGSLTDQRPTERHTVRPWLADVLIGDNYDMQCEVVALQAERAFWEKATILHAEHHRAADSSTPGRYARHYSDVAAMAKADEVTRALGNASMRRRVVDWKHRFFARAWARYDLAQPGTFRLVPPDFRHAELTLATTWPCARCFSTIHHHLLKASLPTSVTWKLE